MWGEVYEPLVDDQWPHNPHFAEELNKMLDQHLSGKRDNWRQLWCVFIFLVWYDEYFVKR